MSQNKNKIGFDGLTIQLQFLLCILENLLESIEEILSSINTSIFGKLLETNRNGIS